MGRTSAVPRGGFLKQSGDMCKFFTSKYDVVCRNSLINANGGDDTDYERPHFKATLANFQSFALKAEPLTWIQITLL